MAAEHKGNTSCDLEDGGVDGALPPPDVQDVVHQNADGVSEDHDKLKQRILAWVANKVANSVVPGPMDVGWVHNQEQDEAGRTGRCRSCHHETRCVMGVNQGHKEQGDLLMNKREVRSPPHTIQKRKQSHGVINDLDNVDFYSHKRRLFSSGSFVVCV